jgi:hypothetical protein
MLGIASSRPNPRARKCHPFIRFLSLLRPDGKTIAHLCGNPFYLYQRTVGRVQAVSCTKALPRDNCFRLIFVLG